MKWWQQSSKGSSSASTCITCQWAFSPWCSCGAAYMYSRSLKRNGPRELAALNEANEARKSRASRVRTRSLLHSACFPRTRARTTLSNESIEVHHASALFSAARVKVADGGLYRDSEHERSLFYIQWIWRNNGLSRLMETVVHLALGSRTWIFQAHSFSYIKEHDFALARAPSTLLVS